MKNRRPTGGITLHNTILRKIDFCLQYESLVGLSLGVALSLIANKGVITINLLAGLVPLLPFLTFHKVSEITPVSMEFSDIIHKECVKFKTKWIRTGLLEYVYILRNHK